MRETQTAQILITHGPGEGTLLYGTNRGDGTAAVLSPLGWRWSRRITCWYLPRSRDKAPARATIEGTAAALDAAGHAVAVEIDETSRPTAEIEADRIAHEQERADALADRATRAAAHAAATHNAARELSDRMPLGQPILVGHHSQRAMERAYERISRHWDQAADAAAAADETARRAQVAAHATGARYSPITVANRIQGLQADLRGIDRRLTGHTRTISVDAAGRRAVETTPAAAGPDRERLLARKAELTDQLAYWESIRAEQIEAGAALDLSPATVSRGDSVRVNGRWYEVVRVNAKSVTVPSCLGTWTDTVRYDKITAHRPATAG